MKKRFLRIWKWEFWPFWVFYIPIYFYWFYLSLRARSFFFFSAANPLMELGGFSNYSKYNVLKNIPPQFLPRTILVDHTMHPASLATTIQSHGLHFPIIAKPDRGERGKKVRKVQSFEDLVSYLQAMPGDTILQEFIEYPLEFGVMYYRAPNEVRGHISSVVQKEFLSVIGDGSSTVEDLIRADSRSSLFLEHIQKNYPLQLKKIPKPGEKFIVEPIGNHSRGTIFLNANHLIKPKLVEVFDQISHQIDGFYFGRYDIKVPKLEDLYTGKNIRILELNGANSEPAHIYDPKMPILKAYRYLFKHWRALYRISIQNHSRGVAYMDQKNGFQMVYRSLTSQPAPLDMPPQPNHG